MTVYQYRSTEAGSKRQSVKCHSRLSVIYFAEQMTCGTYVCGWLSRNSAFLADSHHACVLPFASRMLLGKDMQA